MAVGVNAIPSMDAIYGIFGTLVRYDHNFMSITEFIMCSSFLIELFIRISYATASSQLWIFRILVAYSIRRLPYKTRDEGFFVASTMVSEGNMTTNRSFFILLLLYILTMFY